MLDGKRIGLAYRREGDPGRSSPPRRKKKSGADGGVSRVTLAERVQGVRKSILAGGDAKSPPRSNDEGAGLEIVRQGAGPRVTGSRQAKHRMKKGRSSPEGKITRFRGRRKRGPTWWEGGGKKKSLETGAQKGKAPIPPKLSVQKKGGKPKKANRKRRRRKSFFEGGGPFRDEAEMLNGRSSARKKVGLAARKSGDIEIRGKNSRTPS